jgi:hypothetical protein
MLLFHFREFDRCSFWQPARVADGERAPVTGLTPPFSSAGQQVIESASGKRMELTFLFSDKKDSYTWTLGQFIWLFIFKRTIDFDLK